MAGQDFFTDPMYSMFHRPQIPYSGAAQTASTVNAGTSALVPQGFYNTTSPAIQRFEQLTQGLSGSGQTAINVTGSTGKTPYPNYVEKRLPNYVERLEVQQSRAIPENFGKHTEGFMNVADDFRQGKSGNGGNPVVNPGGNGGNNIPKDFGKHTEGFMNVADDFRQGKGGNGGNPVVNPTGTPAIEAPKVAGERLPNYVQRVEVQNAIAEAQKTGKPVQYVVDGKTYTAKPNGHTYKVSDIDLTSKRAQNARNIVNQTTGTNVVGEAPLNKSRNTAAALEDATNKAKIERLENQVAKEQIKKQRYKKIAQQQGRADNGFKKMERNAAEAIKKNSKIKNISKLKNFAKWGAIGLGAAALVGLAAWGISALCKKNKKDDSVQPEETTPVVTNPPVDEENTTVVPPVDDSTTVVVPPVDEENTTVVPPVTEETEDTTKKEYEVKKGDCVWNIAKAALKEELGRIPTDREILERTHKIVDNPENKLKWDEKRQGFVLITPGQKLNIAA